MVKKRTLELIKMARCADVSDALDSMGKQDIYVMTTDMRPLIPLTRFCGIAKTMEYKIINERMPEMSYEEFEKLQYTHKKDGGYGYNSNAEFPEMDMPKGEEGDVFICAAHGVMGGIFGSANGLELLNEGVEGIILDGFMRDTPESILQKLPVFSKGISFVHPQGRIGIAEINKPVTCAGVLVNPGDIVCADHDGIIVVPQELADEVAYRAYKIQQIDRKDRRNAYIKLGMEFDETVELLPDIDRTWE